MLALAAVAAVLAGCGPFGGPPGAERDCATALLSDWADGAIDRTYPDPAAIDAMPEDVRAYTTAKDDITRALYSHRDTP
jgi:hypothetical protein